MIGESTVAFMIDLENFLIKILPDLMIQSVSGRLDPE
jgi:hypothetical protein